MERSKIAAGLAVASSLTAGWAAGVAQRNVDGNKYDIGATVSIQGCVVAGEAPDSYVLAGVQEWPVANSPMGKHGPRHYWIDKGVSELKDHVGQTIQLTGKITHLEESELEREPGGWKGGTRVAIELPGRDVVTSPANAGVGRANVGKREDIKITLLKLKVDKLLMVMKTCLP